MADDKIQREIEEILNRLDEFVPEKKPPRRPPRADVASGPEGFSSRLAGISLKHVMLAALALVVVAFFLMPVYPAIGRWAVIGGLILFATSFILSFFSRGQTQVVEKRWRGQVMDLRNPTFGDRLRAWFEAKRRPPR
jgi:hypothetical protein